jgi:hypothetical protein
MKVKHLLYIILLGLLIYIDIFAIIHFGDVDPKPFVLLSWFFLTVSSIVLIILLSIYIDYHKREISKFLNKKIS